MLVNKLIISALSLALVSGVKPSPEPAKKQKKLLVFCKTNGYHHESIAQGKLAIIKLGQENNFAVDTTTDSLMLSDKNLKKYEAIVFLSTTGKVMGEDQEHALQNFIHGGGGFMGIHAAADCEYQWPWYGKMVGGYFKSHPKQQNAKLHVVDKSQPATKDLPDTWDRWDEWYNYKDLNPDVHVLITLDESSYTGGENGSMHPISWYHAYDGGRAFYTGLGHTPESYSDSLYLKHILGGIQYALGN